MVIEKNCLRCHKELPVSAFHRKGSYWDSRCKPCALSHKKIRYLSKKRGKVACYNNVVFTPYVMGMVTERNDIVSLLESFLLEEWYE